MRAPNPRRPSSAALLVLALAGTALAAAPHAAVAQTSGTGQAGSAAADARQPDRPTPEELKARYVRADRFLAWNLNPLVTGDEVDPEFIDGTDRFWYRNKTRQGHAFVLVDPGVPSRRPAFDHDRLAAAMSMAADTAYVGHALPFDAFEFTDGLGEIEAEVGERVFTCDLSAYTCTAREKGERDEPFVASPDGRWEAFVHDFDVWVRPAGGGDSTRLTDDGEQYFGYGEGHRRPYAILTDRPRGAPDLHWSPDSRKIAVPRTDARDVEHMHYVSMTSQRPRHFSQPYALPGDSIIPVESFHVLHLGDDPASGAARNVRVELDPDPANLYLGGSASDSTWSADSERVTVAWITRGSKAAHLASVDAATGAVTRLARDSAATYVELGQREPPTFHVTESGEDAFWWSERTGWAHLWRFGPDGTPRGQVTSGPWAVGSLRHVDEQGGWLYFTARGREEGVHRYYAQLYRSRFDGSQLQRLTPEPTNHEITFTPSGRYFVDRSSTVTDAPVITLRAADDGRVVLPLEEADVSQLTALGWQPPRPFTVKAADGVTDIEGLLYLPTDLDASKRYPVLDHIYPGPQRGSVTSWSFDAGRRGDESVFPLAELGFVVVQIDHRGTPWRSKKFHDYYYGDMGNNGLPDHMAAIRQLAASRPFMDLDRVGIYGHSGGGFASTDAILRHPDFYHVAVSTAGNHDNRSYGHYWGEKYQGLLTEDEATGRDSYYNQVNYELADQLEGKLFLMHGDMDDNVHPAMTIQVVNALIEADEDFDLMILPDRAHGLAEPWVMRNRWDYFVEHLIGVEPAEHTVKRPEN